MRDILSEKPEDIRSAVCWAKELQARREKSEVLTRELQKKFAPDVLKKLEAAACAD